MKILWASNAPWAPSGYGGQTLQVVRRMKEAGHDVAVAANFGSQGRVIVDDLLPGVPILPALYDGIGNDILPAHYQAWSKGEPCQLITLYDVWPYVGSLFKDIPLASWVPIDHYPVPPAVADWCKEHESIAMSKFGQERLADAGIESIYIPHAIERSTFKPDPAARADLGWDPEAFYVLITAANKGSVPPRKAWNEMFGALALFMNAHDDVRVWLHTERIGAQSPDLQAVMNAWRIDPDRVEFTPQYPLKVGQIEQSDLARLYAGSDVLLATSMGEGFGIPVAESMACGTPALVSNWTAQPEIVGDAGFLCDVQPWWDQAQSAFFGMPIISSIQLNLEAAYATKRDEPEKWADLKARAIAKSAEYDADKVWTEAWVPYLASLEARYAKPTRQERRKRARKLAAVK